MIKKEITVNSPTGLDTIPAGKFCKVAMQYESNLIIEAKGKTCRGKSLLSIMSVGIRNGCNITLLAEGPDEKELIAAIVQLNENEYK